MVDGGSLGVEWLIELACRTAPIRGARVAAAVCARSKVLGVGQNALKSHPFQARWGRSPEAIYWHAETRAIHDALDQVTDTLRGAEIFVVRVHADHSLALSRPCAGCAEAIAHYEISAVHYTDHTGWQTIATGLAA